MAKIQNYRAIKYQVHKTEHGLDIYYIVCNETIVIISRRVAAICKLHLCDEAHRYLANNNHFLQIIIINFSSFICLWSIFAKKRFSVTTEVSFW